MLVLSPVDKLCYIRIILTIPWTDTQPDNSEANFIQLDTLGDVFGPGLYDTRENYYNATIACDDWRTESNSVIGCDDPYFSLI